MGTYLIGPIVPPEFLSVKANHGKTQECMTGILSILPCGQNQRNLRTIAELCIRWFTVTTKLYLLKSHLCGQRSGSRASGRCFSDLGRSSLWTTGWNCVLQIPNTPVFFPSGKDFGWMGRCSEHAERVLVPIWQDRPNYGTIQSFSDYSSVPSWRRRSWSWQETPTGDIFSTGHVMGWGKQHSLDKAPCNKKVYCNIFFQWSIIAPNSSLGWIVLWLLEARLHDPAGLLRDPFGVLCPWRCHHWPALATFGPGPQPTGAGGFGGRISQTMVTYIF